MDFFNEMPCEVIDDWMFRECEEDISISNYSTQYSPRDITCRYCEVGGLRWENTDTGWRLFDRGSNRLHICEDEELYDY